MSNDKKKPITFISWQVSYHDFSTFSFYRSHFLLQSLLHGQERLDEEVKAYEGEIVRLKDLSRKLVSSLSSSEPVRFSLMSFSLCFHSLKVLRPPAAFLVTIKEFSPSLLQHILITYCTSFFSLFRPNGIQIRLKSAQTIAVAQQWRG